MTAAGMLELAAVEQVDRDAAAELHLVVAGNRSPFDHRCAEAIRNGRNDHWPIVQAFARHRIAGQAEFAWQPIETAPKDGSFVALNSTSSLWRYPFVGLWNEDLAWWDFADPNMSACFAVSELVDLWCRLPVLSAALRTSAVSEGEGK